MSIFRNKIFLAMVTALAILGSLIICLRSSREACYDGKSVSFWCDHLPPTVQLPGAGFAKGFYSSTNLQENKMLREMQEQALVAIDALGTKCLPELLSRLRRKDSPSQIQIQSRILAVRMGLIKPSGDPREMALTGILELGDRAKAIEPELTALKNDTDPWLSAAASYAVKSIRPRETGPQSWEEKLRTDVSNVLKEAQRRDAKALQNEKPVKK